MSASAEIRVVVEQFFQAIRDKDANAFVSLLADNFTAFEQPPPLQVTGDKATRPSHIQPWFDTWDGPIGLDTPDWTYHAGDDCGFAYGLSRLHGRKVDAEKESSVWFRRTLCLRYIDGAWKVQADHQSVPYLMDGSAKALLDLTPGDKVDAAKAVSG